MRIRDRLIPIFWALAAFITLCLLAMLFTASDPVLNRARGLAQMEQLRQQAMQPKAPQPVVTPLQAPASAPVTTPHSLTPEEQARADRVQAIKDLLPSLPTEYQELARCFGVRRFSLVGGSEAMQIGPVLSRAGMRSQQEGQLDCTLGDSELYNIDVSTVGDKSLLLVRNNPQDAWAAMPTPVGLHDMAVSSSLNSLLIVRSRTLDNGTVYQSDVYTWQWNTRAPKLLAHLPRARFDFAVDPVGEGQWLIHGGNEPADVVELDNDDCSKDCTVEYASIGNRAAWDSYGYLVDLKTGTLRKTSKLYRAADGKFYDLSVAFTDDADFVAQGPWQKGGEQAAQ